MRIKRAGTALVGALALTATSMVVVSSAGGQAPPGPRFGENYLLPPVTPARARDVPGLAVNPANQDHIVEAESDPVNLECNYNVSFDGGRTWTGGHLRIRPGGEDPPFPVPACNQNFDSGGYHHFNTGIVFGSGQNVYITFSVKRGLYNRPEGGPLNAAPENQAGPGDDIVVARSTDGGRTFEPATLAIPSTPAPQPFRIRPQIAVERGAGAGGQDRLYVNAWECFIKGRTGESRLGGCSGGGGDRRMFFARSDDGGATWSAPALASRANVRTDPEAIADAASPDEQAREPSQPVVGPDGAVYMAYRSRDLNAGTTCPPNPAAGGAQRDCIVVTRSLDRGQTWQQFSTGVPLSGFVGHPRLAINPSTPAGAGTLYVAYQGPSGSDPDIILQRSTDRGQTWSDRVRVNDDAAGNFQNVPWVAVGPGGSVHVTWNDRRHVYPGSIVSDTYHATSTNGGTSFAPNRRVTDRTINHGVGRMGDLGTYTWYGPNSEPLPDGSVLTSWIDSRTGNFDTGYQDIFLSRLSPSAPIGRETIATATAPGLSVRLSQLAYPGGNEAVPRNPGEPVTRPVVANEGDLPGALAGAVLARASWAPLLLSPAGGLPAHVRAEAARLRPEGAYLIGDGGQLSTAVSSELRETTRNGENVVRIAAPNTVVTRDRPAETARRIAEQLRTLPGAPTEAVIANPATPEAASAAALAAALKLPILFVDPRGGRDPVPAPTEAAIRSLGISRALIIGDERVVPTAVQTRLGVLVGNPANVRRLGGANQYETSEAVLSESRSRGLPANVVYVADGARPLEGAALGAAVGRLNGLMLLRPGADTESAEGRLAAPLAGLDPALVDRVVGAIGTGGDDPAAPAIADGPPIGRPLPPRSLALEGCPPARAARNLISLSEANDTRNGTPFGDLIFAGAGNDVVDALAGDDCVDLGTGADRGQGGLGHDVVLGGLGRDRISGLSGNDRLRGNPDADRIDGGRGNDRVFGDQGHDVVFGSFGNDLLHGVAGNDRISGGRGRDRVNGGAGRDRISAGSSNDRVAGDQGNDRIHGNSGNDSIRGNSGADRLEGGTGRDRLSGGSGNDRIDASDDGRDRISCGSGRDTAIVDRIDRVSRTCERVIRR